MNFFKLSTWNWIAAIAHGISAIALGIYFLAKKGGINFNTDLYDIRIKLNQDSPENSELFAKRAFIVSDTLLKAIVIVYFLFTTFFHVLYATDCFGTGAYTKSIKMKNNYFRWIEYAISSTIMTFLIAIICGVKSLDTVVLLIYMNIGMIACGQIVEASTNTSVKIIALLIGWILLAGIVTIFFKSFFTALEDGKNNGYKIPSWVYFIIFPLILWYSSFGFVNIWQAFFPGKRNYEFFERIYIFLSLVSKFNLGFFLAFGLTRPKARKNK